MNTKHRSNQNLNTSIAAILGIAVSCSNLLGADGSAGNSTPFGEGKLSVDARIRYEYIDGENGASDVNALGERTRVGYTIANEDGISAMVEVEDVHFIDSDDRPALDVPTTELNQAWVQTQGIKLGRQIYTLDDHRFIGHVGWRQNIQTFDALTSSFELDSQSKLNLGYLHSVRRINDTSQDLSGIIVNGNRKISDVLNLTAFAYLLDFDQPVLTSSDTFGLRATGSFASDVETYTYSFSCAKQNDNSGSASDFDLDYIAGELNATTDGITFGLGFEILEGDGSNGFTTPLATVHKFNGFADQFAGGSLGLGSGLHQGLSDYYAKFAFMVPNIEIPITLFYHHFETENVSDFLGSEYDAVASYKLNDYATLVSKYAIYETDGQEHVAYGGVDKTVFTFEVNLKY